MAVSSLEKKDGLSDYCILGGSQQNRLSDVERLTLVGGTELVRILNRISRDGSFGGFESLVGGLDLKMLEEAAAFYGERSAWPTPSSFFRPPAGIIAPRITPIHGLADGEISDIEFESCYVPHHPSFSKVMDAIVENRTVHARHWKHTHGSHVTIVAVHGWTMGDQRANSLAFLPGLFYRLGFDIVLLELPFHGRRVTPELREIGHSLFPSGNVVLTNEAVAQTISDLRQLRLILKALGSKEIGCIGMSLGAYVASLWATLDALSFVIPMVPLVSMSDLAWEAIVARGSENLSISPALLERIFSVHCPLSYPVKTASHKTMIVAGDGDTVIPRSHPLRLQAHFGTEEMIWFSGNHDLSGDRDVVFTAIKRFLGHLGLLE